MSPRHHAAVAARLAGAALLVLAAGVAAAGGASAAALPVPAPSSLVDGSPTGTPLTGTPLEGAVTGVTEAVQGTVSGLLAGAGSGVAQGPSGSQAGAAAKSDDQASSGTAGSSDGSGATAGPTTGRASSSSTRQSAASGASQPAAARAVTPVGSVCLIPTGGTSPAFEIGLDVVGQDLSSPLVKQFPQAFAPCPAGAVRADGDTVAALDATIRGLVGACVRVTRQVAPLQTTLVVLDHDLVRELTAAGLPLDQLVVPCPSRAGSSVGGSSTSASAVPAVGSSGSGGGGAASALPARLAFTGSNPGPVLFVAVALLCGGALLVRKAQLVAAARR